MCSTFATVTVTINLQFFNNVAHAPKPVQTHFSVRLSCATSSRTQRRGEGLLSGRCVGRTSLHSLLCLGASPSSRGPLPYFHFPSRAASLSPVLVSSPTVLWEEAQRGAPSITRTRPAAKRKRGRKKCHTMLTCDPGAWCVTALLDYDAL